MNAILRHLGWTKLAGLLCTTILLSLLDLAGIAIIYPLIELVSQPTIAAEKYGIEKILSRIDSTTSLSLVIELSTLFIAFLIAKLCFSIGLTKYQQQTIAGLTKALTTHLFSRLLKCRFSTFQTHSPSYLMGIVYNNPAHATICVTAFVTVLTELTFVGMIVAIAFYINPGMSAWILLVSLPVGLGLTLVFGRFSQQIGRTQSLLDDAKHKLSFATLSAIKDIKIMGIEPTLEIENETLCSRYYVSSWHFNLIASIPRFVLDFLALTSLTLAAIYLFSPENERQIDTAAIGVVIALVVRLLPSVQRSLSAIHQLKFYWPFAKKIGGFETIANDAVVETSHSPTEFTQSITLANVSFRHGERDILKGVSLSIEKGQSIGIVGLSGSGKTTLLDVISGIQKASHGEFLVDDILVDPFHSDAIKQLLGYVPQHVALVDESIAFNITFSKEHNAQRLQEAIRIANLQGFVETLETQLDTKLGETGLRVSGGQRQRIGIARALYKNPEILIFDEATSSLDNITEKEVEEAITSLAGLKTLIIVAHRLSTVRNCDRIYVLKDGKIADSGKYDELLALSEDFKALHAAQERV